MAERLVKSPHECGAWQSWEVTLLHELRAKRLTYAKIGEIIGRSAAAVHRKCIELIGRDALDRQWGGRPRHDGKPPRVQTPIAPPMRMRKHGSPDSKPMPTNLPGKSAQQFCPHGKKWLFRLNGMGIVEEWCSCAS